MEFWLDTFVFDLTKTNLNLILRFAWWAPQSWGSWTIFSTEVISSYDVSFWPSLLKRTFFFVLCFLGPQMSEKRSVRVAFYCKSKIQILKFKSNAPNQPLQSQFGDVCTQVAEARNVSVGEHRHCCVTFEYNDLYGEKSYGFRNLRKWKEFNKKKNSLTYLKCVLRLSCVVQGPIYSRFMGCTVIKSFDSLSVQRRLKAR